MRYVILSKAGTSSQVSINADRVTHVDVHNPDPPTVRITFEKDHFVVTNGNLEDITNLLAGERE